MQSRKQLVQYLSILLIFAYTLLGASVYAQTLGPNLAITGPGVGSDGSGFSNTKTVRDGDQSSYSQSNGTSNQRVSVKWSSAVRFNTVKLREAGSNISSWQLINNDTNELLASGNNIGTSLTVAVGDVNMRKVNLVVNGQPPMRIAEIEVYNATGQPSNGQEPDSPSQDLATIDTSKTYKIVNRNSNRVIGVVGASKEHRANIVQSTDTGALDQRWRLQATSGGYYNITNLNSNKVIGVALASSEHRANIHQTNSTSALDQQWGFRVTSNGFYNLVNRNSQKGVGVVGASTEHRANIVQSNPTTALDQQWSLVAVTETQPPIDNTPPPIDNTPPPSNSDLSSQCVSLITNPRINWRDSGLNDTQVVKCLHDSLGRPVGYGENARGGYNPNGTNKLTVITKNSNKTVEEQILEAIEGDEHNWIVFDKFDFESEHEIGLYRAYCSNSTVQSLLGATEAQCNDYRSWCSSKGFTNNNQCLDEFFNKAMNKSSIPIRIPVIGANTTIDGRMSKAFFRFSGFAIGADSSGNATKTSDNVILTHLDFRGAGHTEDHRVDPDMIRVTGESKDIWIHKNTFETTGDAAFDVKIGASNITISFNKLIDVKRASLHGSSDSRTINEKIKTTFHHNAFITRDSSYLALGNTGRRVPLIRRGESHLFNNLFVNYRKNILSVRVGARVLMEDNAFVVNEALSEKNSLEDSLNELSGAFFSDISGGNFKSDDNRLWFGSSSCRINPSTNTELVASNGTVNNVGISQYSSASRSKLSTWNMSAGQDLIHYVTATAGKNGLVPFNSPLAAERDYAQGLQVSCQ